MGGYDWISGIAFYQQKLWQYGTMLSYDLDIVLNDLNGNITQCLY